MWHHLGLGHHVTLGVAENAAASSTCVSPGVASSSERTAPSGGYKQNSVSYTPTSLKSAHSGNSKRQQMLSQFILATLRQRIVMTALSIHTQYLIIKMSVI